MPQLENFISASPAGSFILLSLSISWYSAGWSSFLGTRYQVPRTRILIDPFRENFMDEYFTFTYVCTLYSLLYWFARCVRLNGGIGRARTCDRLIMSQQLLTDWATVPCVYVQQKYCTYTNAYLSRKQVYCPQEHIRKDHRQCCIYNAVGADNAYSEHWSPRFLCYDELRTYVAFPIRDPKHSSLIFLLSICRFLFCTFLFCTFLFCTFLFCTFSGALGRMYTR